MLNMDKKCTLDNFIVFVCEMCIFDFIVCTNYCDEFDEVRLMY